MQLVVPRLWVVREVRGKQEFFDQIAVREKFGVSPDQYLDYLTLKGDTSDNIPGIPGIGPITAARLINEFASLKNLLANINELDNRLKNSLESNYDNLISTKKFLKINTAIDSESFSNPTDLRYDFDKLHTKTNALLKQIGIT